MTTFKHNSKNKRNLTMAFFSSMLFLIGCVEEESPQAHLQKGVEYFNKGDYEKAMLELKTSGQGDKNIAETHYYLAMLNEKNYQYKTMIENLKRTLELQPTHSEARLKLGQVLLFVGDNSAALEQAEILLKEKSDNSEALLLKASVLIRQKNTDEAKKIIDDVLKVNPNYVGALSLNAFFYSEKEEFDNAFSFINTAIKLDEKNMSLRMFKVQLDAKSKNVDAVIDDYKELVSLNPDNQDLKITLARIYAQASKKKEAEDLLNSLISSKPNDTKLKLLLLDFLSATEPERVEEKLNQFTEQYKKESKTLFSFASWLIAQKHIDNAKKILNQIIALNDNENDVLSAKTQLARIALIKGELETSKTLTDEILAKNSNHIEAKILQSRLLLAKHSYDEAIELLSKILWEKSDSEETLILLGQTYAIKGDEKQADKQFNSVLDINPANLQALTYLYDNAVSGKDFSYAQQLVEKALRLDSENLILLEKLVKVNLLANKLDDAKTALQRITTNTNPQAQNLATYFEGQIFQAQHEYVKAISSYKKVTANVADNYDVLANMAACYDSLNKKSDMILFLNELLSKNAQNVSATLLLGDLLITGKQFDKASLLLNNFIQVNPKIPESYLTLAKAKAVQGDNKSAISVYINGLKENPDNVKLLLPLAASYEIQGEYDAAVATYEKLLKNDSNLDIALNNLSSILTEHYSGEENLKKAVQLSEKFKDSKQPYYKDTYAWAIIKQGDLVKGLNLLNQIITSAPNVAIFRYHLGVAHYKNNNNGAAIAELKQAIELAAKQRGFSDEKAAKSLLDEIQAKSKRSTIL